jgi:DNA polymerase III epsilon subunit-like protein
MPGVMAALAAFSPRIICIDFETTDFFYQDDPAAVVEIGAKECFTHRTFSARANPMKPIAPSASAVSSIHNIDVIDCPSLDGIWPTFVDWIGPGSVTLIAYNGFSFDFRVLQADLQRYGLSPPQHWQYADLLRHVRSAPGFAPVFSESNAQNSLGAVHERVFGTSFPRAHSALGDADALCSLLERAHALSGGKFPLRALTLDDAVSEAYGGPLRTRSQTQQPLVALRRSLSGPARIGGSVQRSTESSGFCGPTQSMTRTASLRLAATSASSAQVPQARVALADPQLRTHTPPLLSPTVSEAGAADDNPDHSVHAGTLVPIVDFTQPQQLQPRQDGELPLVAEHNASTEAAIQAHVQQDERETTRGSRDASSQLRAAGDSRFSPQDAGAQSQNKVDTSPRAASSPETQAREEQIAQGTVSVPAGTKRRRSVEVADTEVFAE